MHDTTIFLDCDDAAALLRTWAGRQSGLRAVESGRAFTLQDTTRVLPADTGDLFRVLPQHPTLGNIELTPAGDGRTLASADTGGWFYLEQFRKWVAPHVRLTLDVLFYAFPSKRRSQLVEMKEVYDLYVLQRLTFAEIEEETQIPTITARRHIKELRDAALID